MYHVALSNFSGPLDTLLSLVEEQKLSINEISLAEIADKYIAYIKAREAISKEELAIFLVIAATLILIKSRSLLPQIAISEDDEISIEELEKRLKTLQFFKTLAENLRNLEKQRIHLFSRDTENSFVSVFVPPHDVTAQLLAQTLQSIVMVLPKIELLPTETIEHVVSLEEKMKELQERIVHTLVFSFADVNKEAKNKTEIIINFLAILELVKQGLLLFEQRESFGTINLKKQHD